MMRWPRLNSFRSVRRWWTDRRGAALDDLVMVAGVTVLGATFLVAGVEMWSAFHTQQVLQQGAQMANADVVASGCLTDHAANSLASFLQSNGLQLSRVHLHAPSTSNVSYGTRQNTVSLGYDVQFVVPFTNAVVWDKYLTAQIPADQSLYVSNDGAALSSCASDLKSVFAGTSNYGSGSGSTSGTAPSVNEVTALTLQASPNPVNAGDPTTLSGIATLSSGADAPSGTEVTITGPTQTQVADVGSNGAFSITETSTTVGNATYTATSGTGSASVTVDVVPSSPAAVAITAPSSVTVGQAFNIQVAVNDSYGDPVANGTNVTISSSDSTDIPTTTEQTTNGSVTDAVPNGMTALGTYSITATSGSVSQTVDITVNPGAPQDVTLTVSPSTITAGQTVTASGVVDGPDGTPVAAGTAVTIASPSDTQDTLPVTTTNSAGDYSATFSLTQAGKQSIVASASGDGTTVSSTPAGVTVNPGAAEQVINFTANPNPVEQGATDTFTGTVEDQYGNVVDADVPITISGSDLTQSVSGVTNNQGAFTLSGTFQGAGTQSINASSNGTALANGTASVTVLATGADQLTASPSSATITAGGSTTVVWTLTDDTGTPVSGIPIQFQLSNGDNSLVTPTSATTNRNGQVSVTVGPLTQAGVVTLEATDADATNVTGTMGITVQAGAPESVLNPVISPSVAQSTSDGGTVDPKITGTVIDAYGNPIPNASVSVTGGWDSGSFTGTTTSEGTFAIALDPVTIGGPYDPTIAVSNSQGSNTATYSSTSLTVVQHIYQLILSAANGSSSTPAGTPYGITATLTEAGAPVSGASITFTVPSGDTATTWASGGATPSPTGPTSITATTNSSGQVTVKAAFESNLGNQTVHATYSADNTNATMAVSVEANQPSTMTWTSPTPDPVTAGNSFVVQGTLIDSYGFPVAAGEQVTVAFESDSAQVWVTRAGGLIGYASPSNAQQWFTPTKAGTWDVVIYGVNSARYNQSGDPTLPDVAETVDPGPIQYFWPVLANTSDQWEPGMSWTNGADASQGPTNAYGTLNIDTPTNGQPFALAGIGYDAYGNAVDSGAATASVTCTAASGGTCPSLPGSVNGAYADTGGFTAGQYTLNFTPTGSPYPAGVSSSPTTTAITFSLLGLQGWNVQVGDGSSILGSGGPGNTIALGTLPSGVDTLNFSIEGLDQNNNVFTGYTNNATNQEGVICLSATNGGVCPGGSSGSTNVWLSNTIPLGSSGTPDGYTNWSSLTTFTPGTYTLSIRAGQYGDAGGQNWVPTWNNTHVTFTIPPGESVVVGAGNVYAWTSGTEYNLGAPGVGFYSAGGLLYLHGFGLLATSWNSTYDVPEEYLWNGSVWTQSELPCGTGSDYGNPQSYSAANGEYTLQGGEDGLDGFYVCNLTSGNLSSAMSAPAPVTTDDLGVYNVQTAIAPNGTIADYACEEQQTTYDMMCFVDQYSPDGSWTQVWSQNVFQPQMYLGVVAYNSSSQLLYSVTGAYLSSNDGTYLDSNGTSTKLTSTQFSNVVYDSGLGEWIGVAGGAIYSGSGTSWQELPGSPTFSNDSSNTIVLAYNATTNTLAAGGGTTVYTWANNTWTEVGTTSSSQIANITFAKGIS